MTEVLALGAAYLAGVGPTRLVLLGLVLYAPLILLPLVLVVVALSRRSLEDRAPVFCDTVASELRAGATLRASLLTATRSARVRLDLPAGAEVASVDEVASAVAAGVPVISSELQHVVRASARAGGATADLFDELASIAIAQGEIAREVRIASAPARATAWFFVLAPTSFMVVRLFTGGFDGLLASTAQRVTAVAGVLLFLAGLSAIWVLMWRAG